MRTGTDIARALAAESRRTNTELAEMFRLVFVKPMMDASLAVIEAMMIEGERRKAELDRMADDGCPNIKDL